MKKKDVRKIELEKIIQIKKQQFNDKKNKII
jgi:hypothetical protein